MGCTAPPGFGALRRAATRHGQAGPFPRTRTDSDARTAPLPLHFPDLMPRRRTSGPQRPAPLQLPLFAETASLVRIRPDRNEFRYYRLDVWPDLFGCALLVRHWGRIGTEGRRRLEPHPDAGAALNALAALARQKRRRGYRDRMP